MLKAFLYTIVCSYLALLFKFLSEKNHVKKSKIKALGIRHVQSGTIRVISVSGDFVVFIRSLKKFFIIESKRE